MPHSKPSFYATMAFWYARPWRLTAPFGDLWARAGAHANIELLAKEDPGHRIVAEPALIDALEYGCVHDFVLLDFSIASYAAGAVVQLCGRSEGGKTLSRATVFAVLTEFSVWSTMCRAVGSDSGVSQGSIGLDASVPVKRFKISLQRVATMAISDANKRIMILEYANHDIIGVLLRCTLMMGGQQLAEGEEKSGLIQGSSFPSGTV